MKVSDLTGADLDYWVAQIDPRCEGLSWEWRADHWAGMCDVGVATVIANDNLLHRMKLRKKYDCEEYRPARDWAQGGPIIEREMIELSHEREWMESGEFGRVWQGNHAGYGYCDGDTPLIAAMRCFVASKFGGSVPDQAVA